MNTLDQKVKEFRLWAVLQILSKFDIDLWLQGYNCNLKHLLIIYTP